MRLNTGFVELDSMPGAAMRDAHQDLEWSDAASATQAMGGKPP